MVIVMEHYAVVIVDGVERYAIVPNSYSEVNSCIVNSDYII